MYYARAITVAAAAADLYGPAAKTTLVLQYGLLHYLVTCPQTGIPCLPVCKMTACKMILLHSLQFSRKYLYRICLTSCAVIRWPPVTRWIRQRFPYYIQVDVVCVLVDIFNIVFLLIPSTLRCSWEVKESWHSWVVDRGKVSETLNCNFKLMQLLLEEVFYHS